MDPGKVQLDSSMNDLEALTTHCIRCGFCLEACPTFSLTGNEAQSPRGRIYLVRSALTGSLPWREIEEPLGKCLGCRACETACPSGVEYGQILEMARAKSQTKKSPVAGLLRGLTDPTLLRLQLVGAKLLHNRTVPSFIAKNLNDEPQEAKIPEPQALPRWPDIPDSELPPIKGDVFLLQGCAMGVLFPRVHLASQRLLRRAGYRVRMLKGCCGALHAHSGLLDEAAKRASDLIAQSADLPIITNSAGCGSTMKEYGALLGTKAASAFAGRVRDLSEFLADEHFEDVVKRGKGATVKAIYHDACHLAHGQGITGAPRTLLSAIPGIEMLPLKEADMCCGSAGIYNLTQPKMARSLLDRKWNHVAETGARWLVLGNPGCHAWLNQAAHENGDSVKVLHLAEALEVAIGGYFV